MAGKRRLAAISGLAIGGVFAALLLLYLSAYFWLGHSKAYVEPDEDTGRPVVKRVVRTYRTRWTSNIFRPAGELESRLRGVPVYVGSALNE